MPEVWSDFLETAVKEGEDPQPSPDLDDPS